MSASKMSWMLRVASDRLEPAGSSSSSAHARVTRVDVNADDRLPNTFTIDSLAYRQAAACRQQQQCTCV